MEENDSLSRLKALSMGQIWRTRIFNFLGFCFSCFLLAWTLWAGVPGLWFALQTYFWFMLMPIKEEKTDTKKPPQIGGPCAT